MTSATQAQRDTWQGHPKGLFFLFGTELWERFSFYGMRFLLPLFLAAKSNDANPGWGWVDNEGNLLPIGGLLACCYAASVYITGIAGGWFAQQYTGAKNAVIWGALIQCVGHFVLGASGLSKIWFFCALWLLVLGTALLKPTVSGLVSLLYKKGDSKKDDGFSIFYMGVNIGAFLAAILSGLVGEQYNFHAGFSLAGFGMLVSILVFIQGSQYISDTEAPLIKKGSIDWYIKWFSIPIVALLGIAIVVFGFETMKNLGQVKITTLLRCVALAAVLSIIGYLTYIRQQAATKVQKDRWSALGIMLIALFVFQMGFDQPGNFLGAYIKAKVGTEIGNWKLPSAWFNSTNPICIVLFTGLVVKFWSWLRVNYRTYSSSASKVGIGCLLSAISFMFLIGAEWTKTVVVGEGGKESPIVGAYWIVLLYAFITLAELCIMPVVLSFTTKLVPQNMVPTAMGLFFAVAGLGSYAATVVTDIAKSYSSGPGSSVALNMGKILVLLSATVGILFLIFNKKIMACTHGAENLIAEDIKLSKKARKKAKGK